MKRLTPEELIRARAGEDWNVLQAEAVPLVDFALRSFKYDTQEYEDFRQEGLRAAFETLRKWNPETAAFSTHIVRYVKWALLDYSRANRGVVAGAMQQDLPLDAPIQDDPEDENATAVDRLTYGDEPPAGFGGAEETLRQDGAQEAAETLLGYTDAETGELLRRLYGLDGPAQSVRALAQKVYRVPPRTLLRTARQAENSLAHLRESSVNGRTGRLNAVSGPRAARRTHVRADRFHGFWSGATGVINMGGIWRESTGKVWNDWSWKPTALDIKTEHGDEVV